jgi:hypothetical protein
MTRETLEWLAWLVSQQTVQLGAPDAREQTARAFAALDEIGAALEQIDVDPRLPVPNPYRVGIQPC